MKRNSGKYITAFVMALLLSLIAANALAAYRSYSGSIASYQDFRDGTNNTTGYDADGGWGRQCWDGVQVFYLRIGMSLSTGNIYDANGEREAYAKHCWDDPTARSVNTGSQFTQITNIADVRRGDIVVLSGPSKTGHIGFADEDNNPAKSTITLWAQNHGGHYNEYYRCNEWYFTAAENNKSYFLGAFRYKGWNSEVRGSEMSQGFDQTIPDGDYLIAAAAASRSAFYYLDIEGTARPAAVQTNVSLCGPYSGDPPVHEIWTVTYNSSDKFYTITQKGTDISLDVAGGDTLQGTNIQVYTSNSSGAQKWAIERNGTNGYRIRPKCSGGGNNGMCLDIGGGSISNGANIQQWKINNTDAQSWLFIPYQPSQPVGDGRYILLYSANPGYEVDIPGDTGDIDNNTNVQLWTDNAPSEFNSFDVIALSNGYYKIKHHASGKCLEVSDGLPNYKANVALFEDNGSIRQQWAVLSNGSGYSLISRCNGYALDLPDGTTEKGSNIETYPRLNNNNQRWSFVHAEQAIHYRATEGENYPTDQVKFYKTDLTLSSTVPVRNGYEFVCWEDILSLDENLNTDKYYPGDIYTVDEGLELYPVWRQIVYDYIITYDANGGTGAPPAQRVTTASATLSDVRPHRAHYTFLGWATTAGSAAAAYQPGDPYSGNANITLYAVWQHNLDNLMVLPASLTEIESEAFTGISADAFVIPASVTSIGANAFEDVVIYGYTGSYAESYAGANGLIFIPITDEWVPEDAVPSGAHVIDEKWTYTLTTTETTTSTASSLPGWTQNGYTWQQSGTGVWKYANYPGGFDTGNSLYSKYNKSALAAGEQSTGSNTKRDAAGESSTAGYIYWHWTFTDYVEEADRNVIIENARKLNVNIYGSVYRDFIYFDAFETTTSLSQEGMSTSGLKVFDGLWSTYHHPEYNLPEYASWWWYRIEVMQQPYTDYQKLFTYVKENAEIFESSTQVLPGDNISNIQHWIKYSF